jgi:site-specific DNA-methyltransferase (adenine-specific)
MVFTDDNSGKAKRVIVQVKSGHVKSGDIRDLGHTVDREKAAIGVFLTLEKPSRDMTTEAIGTGFYESEHFGKFPKLQILTVEELLNGNTVKLPPSFLQTFKQAEKHIQEDQQAALFED